MLQRWVHLSASYLVCVVIVGGLSVTLENINAVRRIGPSELTREPFFTDSALHTGTKVAINDVRAVHRGSSYSSRSANRVKSDLPTFRTKAELFAKRVSILQREKKNSPSPRGKKSNGQQTDTPKVPAVNNKERMMHTEVLPTFKPIATSRMRYKAADVNRKRRKLIGAAMGRTAEAKRGETARNFQDSTAGKNSSVEEGDRTKYLALDVTCGNSSLNETSSSLRSLFRVPKMRRPSDCSGGKGGVVGTQRIAAAGQSSAAVSRFSDKGHTELVYQYEKEQSLDELAGEYVHPGGHVSPSIVDCRKTHVAPSVFASPKRILQYGSVASNSKYSFNDDLPAARFFTRNYENGHFSGLEVDDTLDNIVDNIPGVETLHNDDGFKLDYYLSLKHKRDVDSALDDRVKSSGEKRIEGIERHEEKLDLKGVSLEAAEKSQDDTTQIIEQRMRNSTSQILFGLREFDHSHTTDTPWPIVPGPISCDLDFQLQPSFVAKLGEFDYVVSVQLQRNPDEPADHACTGVVYNPRFIVIAPHCLHDNYGLTVTSTDDLCTIDEMIDVDYIIEHENYDAETRRNDIALIKLKSEIHKRSAKFANDDGALGNNFFAVGFGELMWRSFPDKISKLLQKVPVRRYPRVMKEAPGTLHITTSHMDLTGTFRGDFGGALINPRGEFVGLKSKLVKKSTEYEVYTRVRTYLPWIQSMVALHGSW